jgi:hypothetical protein
MAFFTTATLAMAIDGDRARSYTAHTAFVVRKVADWDDATAHYWGTAGDWAAAEANAPSRDDFIAAMEYFDAIEQEC